MKLNETTRRTSGFSDKYAAFRHVVSLFSGLPALRGLWTANHFATNGDWEDWTKYDLMLTANGAPSFTYDGLTSYWSLDGAADYFSRANEAALDITGTEAHLAAGARGLTLGGWYESVDDTPAAVESYMTKMAPAGNFSYTLAHTVAGAVDFAISDDGTNFDSVVSTATTSGRSFVCGRFDPSTEVAVWVNNVKAVVVAGVGASIFSGNGPFQISGWGGANNLFTGAVFIAFLCAAALPDDMIGALFQQSRALYGV